MKCIKEYRALVNQAMADRKHSKAVVASEVEKRLECRKTIANVAKAQSVLQELAQKVQQDAHHQIAQVVTRCLQAIFDDPYEFQIRFERKRGKTEAKLVFIRGDLELEDPKDEAGIGVLDVASFALRLASLILTRPCKRRVLILDEPFRFLHSTIYLSRIRDMLLTLAKEMECQFILVTQIEELRVGKVIDLAVS